MDTVTPRQSWGPGDRLAYLGLLMSLLGCTINSPKWPFGTAPADLLTIPGMGLMAIGGAWRGARVPAGAWLGMWLMLITGVWPIFFSTGAGEAFATILKLLYLFLWAALGTGTIRRLGIQERAMHAMGAILVLTSVLVIFSRQLRALPVMSALISEQQWRPAGTFDNPNMTAAFLLVGLLYLPWGLRPHTLAWGVVGRLVVLYGFVLAGSFGALIGLALALLIVALCRALSVARPLRTWTIAAVAFGSVCGLALISLVPSVALPLAPIGDAIFPERNFVSSVMDRVRNTDSTLVLWRESPWIGQGAGLLGQRQQEQHLIGYGGHNEFATTLAERGVFGFVGLAAILGISMARGVRGTHAHDRKLATQHAVHLGCLVGLAAYGTSHDVIHHRILWVVLMLLWSLPIEPAPSRDDELPVAAPDLGERKEAQRPAINRP